MKQNKNFFDELDNGWEDILTDNYKRHADELIYKTEEYILYKINNTDNDAEFIAFIDVLSDKKFTINIESLIKLDKTESFKVIFNTDCDIEQIFYDNPIGSIYITCELDDKNNISNLDTNLYFGRLEVVHVEEDSYFDSETIYSNNIFYKDKKLTTEIETYLNPCFFIEMLDLNYDCLLEQYTEHSIMDIEIFKNIIPLVYKYTKQELITVLDKNNKSYNETK